MKGLLDTLLDAPVDNSRSHLDCVLDACASPSLLALSRCGWRLHLALAPPLQRAEQTSEDGICAHLGMSLTQLTAMLTLTWTSGLPVAQCRHLGTWLRAGGPLEGVVTVCIRHPAGDDEEDQDEDEDYVTEVYLLPFRSDETRQIELEDNDIDDDLVITLAHAMGSMGSLKELSLFSNQIGDAGMISLSEVIGKGSMGALKYLSLGSNQIGDAGLQALVGAIGNGSLRALTCLDLEGNQIGDPGMIEFSRSIGNGSLATLIHLYIYSNPGDTAPLTHACATRGIRCYSIHYELY